MKTKVNICVEFTAEEVKALLIAEVERSVGPAPDGTVYSCNTGYHSIYDMTVENVPVEQERKDGGTV
jgi:hypothetical protein